MQLGTVPVRPCDLAFLLIPILYGVAVIGQCGIACVSQYRHVNGDAILNFVIL